MKYRNGIIALGFLVIVVRFTGFPEAWRESLYALAGLGIVALAYLAGKERKAAPAEPKPTEDAGITSLQP